MDVGTWRCACRAATGNVIFGKGRHLAEGEVCFCGASPFGVGTVHQTAALQDGLRAEVSIPNSHLFGPSRFDQHSRARTLALVRILAGHYVTHQFHHAGEQQFARVLTAPMRLEYFVNPARW